MGRAKDIEAKEATLKAESQRNPLVGKYFHSFTGDKETLKWQGQITAEVSAGMFLVQFFEWLTGSESNQQIVPVADMVHWQIYDSLDEMNNAFSEIRKK